MAATETILLKIAGDAAGGIKALQQINQKLKSLLPNIDKLAAAGKTMGVVFGGMAAAGGKLIQSSAKIAMRNEVLALSLRVTGENAGFSRDRLDEYVDGVKAMGITTQQATLGVTRMIQGQLDLGRATDLARSSQDLAVIAGQNSSETYGNIMQSVLALQPRLLRQYGIVATTNQILGDLSDSTDTAAKRNRFLQYVLEEASKVSGVYANATDLVGKQISSLPRLIEEAQNSFGKYFIPLIGKGVQFLSKLLKMFNALPEPVKKALALFVGLGVGIAGALAAVGGLLAALPIILGGLSTLVGALPALLPILAGLAAALGILLGGVKILQKAWADNWGGIRTAVQDALAQIMPLIRMLGDLVKNWAGVLRNQFAQLRGDVTNLLGPMFADLAGLIRSINWVDLFATFADAINVAGRYVSALLQTIHGLLSGEGLAAFEPMHGALVDVLTLIALTWQKYISKALAWGYNLVLQIAKGIIQAARAVLVGALKMIGQIVGQFLAPGSPPEKGPLSNIIKWGKGVIDTYFKAFEKADFGLLREALSPVEGFLRAAVGAGDIDDKEFGQIFGAVREQAAGLIATFRETGEISEEALGKIAETLGEGGEELTKYLRLQLEHERALERLAGIQDEYAEAEEAGFVPKALKDKLKAAEEEAESTGEAVDWQKEYLAAQQETIDIQQQMLDAMEGLTDALTDGAGGAGDLKDALGGAGDAAEGLSGTDLGMEGLGGAGLGDLRERLSGVGGAVKGLSGDFLAMRQRVEGFLALPMGEKLRIIVEKFSELTGLDIIGFWDRVTATLQEIDEKGLLAVIGEWAQAGLDYVKANWKGWAQTIGTAMINTIAQAVIVMSAQIGALSQKVIAWYGEIVTRFLAWVQSKYVAWGDSLARFMTGAMVQLLQVLTSDIPRWASEKIAWMGDIITRFLTWFGSEMPSLAMSLFNHMTIALGSWLSKLWESVGTWVGQLTSWMGDIIASFSSDTLANIGNWIGDLASVGKAIVDALWAGIQAAWGSLVAKWERALADLADKLPWSEPKDKSSPLYGLSESGRALVENFAAGIDFSGAKAALTTQLSDLRSAVAAGPTTVYQNIDGGLVFPNVKGGRDAASVRRELEERASEASMSARTAGSIA